MAIKFINVAAKNLISQCLRTNAFFFNFLWFSPNLPPDRDDIRTLPTLSLPQTLRQHDAAECSQFFPLLYNRPRPDTGWSELSFLNQSHQWLSESGCPLQPEKTDMEIIVTWNRTHVFRQYVKLVKVTIESNIY